MILDGQRNRRYAIEHRASAEKYASSAKLCHDSLDVITKGYNSLLDGKWNHIMTMKQGFAAAYFELPKLFDVGLTASPSLGIAVEQEDGITGRGGYHILPTFNTYFRIPYYIDVFSKGCQRLSWTLRPSDSWIKVSMNAGNENARVEVSVDWDAVPAG